jgi:uncharacterized protein YggE
MNSRFLLYQSQPNKHSRFFTQLYFLLEATVKRLSVSPTIIIIGVLVIALLVVGFPATGVQTTRLVQASDTPPAGCDPGRTVQVSGTAVINVVPDRASIQLGVQSNGSTPDQVQAANTAAIQQVIGALKSLGIESKDIATDWYIIDPIYEDYDSLTIKGYRIHNIVAVTLRDVSKTSTVIATALKAGANQVVNVEFYTSELRKYRDQARDMAMKAASEKAQALAGAAGAKTGCIMTINENTWSYYNGWYGRSINQWTQNTVQNVAPAGGQAPTDDEGPVSLGQISIRAEVSASFGLK